MFHRFRKLFEQLRHSADAGGAGEALSGRDELPRTRSTASSFENYIDWIAPAYLITLVSLPAATAPAGLSQDGLPVGMQIVAPRFEEPLILQRRAPDPAGQRGRLAADQRCRAVRCRGEAPALWIKDPLAIFADGAERGIVVQGRPHRRAGRRPGANRARRDVKTFDAGEHVVLPGLINTHHHFYQTLTRAVPAALDRELFPWLQALYPIWARLTPEALDLAHDAGDGRADAVRLHHDDRSSLCLSRRRSKTPSTSRSRRRGGWACACC